MHERLYGRYLAHRAAVVADPEKFVAEAAGLIRGMEESSARVTCLEDYEWLQTAAEKWRSIFVSVLNIPQDIRLAPSPVGPAVVRRAMIWSDRDLEGWIELKAFELAKHRALRRWDSITAEELLRRAPSTPEEAKEDWTTAQVLLAAEIIDGKLDLAQIRPRSYVRLESCWLEEIKGLKAYFRWLDRGGGWDAGMAEIDYLDACSEIQSRVLSAEGKRSEWDFHPIRQYLEDRYLQEGRIDAAKATGLIEIKARRLWEKGRRDGLQNWLTAESYVHGFYDSIVPAVCSGDHTCQRKVSDLVCALEPASGHHLIVNGFETAVAAAYLPSAFADVAALAAA